ncbi:FMN-binding protein [Candidatus Kuenenia sp.]|uniref:FMN-binding protein n=1 Tax=Candidatus Kuenenia sp. TaxID=2499824 RepID=UPI00321F7D9B
MEEFKTFILRIFSIIFIAFIPCTGLFLVYFYTAPKIAAYHEIKEKRAVLDIFGIPYRTTEKTIMGFTIKGYDKDNIREVFDTSITVEETEAAGAKSEEEGKVYKFIKDGELQGVGFIWSRIGYGYNKSSAMSLFICLKPDMETLKGIEVLDHSETPGLGGRMTEDMFKEQFIGMKLKPQIKMVKERKATGDNEFDAITGATNTSRGIEVFINDAVQEFWGKSGEQKW